MLTVSAAAFFAAERIKIVAPIAPGVAPRINMVLFTGSTECTKRSITSLRPGAMSPGGSGVDIKHNSYDRYLNRQFLEAINWTPFNHQLNSGLDWSMWLKAMKTNQEIGILECDRSVQLLSISTDKWINKHKFTDHWTGSLKSERCDVSMLDKEFSEIKQLL